MSVAAPPRLFGVLALAWLAAAAGAAGGLVHQRIAAGRELAALGSAEAERDRLAAVSPEPSEASALAIQRDLAATAGDVRLRRRQLGMAREGAAAATGPADPAAAYFGLMEYAGRLEARARRAGVATRSGERFGFNTYAEQGPPQDLLSVVHRQQVVLEPVLDLLFAAGPASLLGVQREHPRAADSPEAPGGGAAWPERAPATSEVFSRNGPDIGESSGWVTATAFRVSFAGETASLRRFLITLVASELPVVVEAVEAEPWEPAGTDAPAGSIPAGRRGDAKFTVTWLALEWVGADATGAAP